MKKLYLFFLLSLCLLNLAHGQHVPYGMRYQAVARDLSGQVLGNKTITLRISLVSNYTDKVAHYTETHKVTTNQLGLFTLVVGEGKVEKGLFKNIPWSTEDIWMQVDIQTDASTKFVTISSSKLLAVPYAFHAGTATELVGTTKTGKTTGSTSSANGNTPGVPSQVWSLFGNSGVNSLTDFLGTTTYADLVMITNNLERLRITKDGAVNIKNDLNVGNNVDIGNDLRVHRDAAIDRNTVIGNNLTVNKDVSLNTVSGATINNGALTVANGKATTLTGALRVDGATNLNSSLSVNNASSTNLSGLLHVVGATGLDNTLTVGGASSLNNTLAVTGATQLNNTLTATGAAAMGNTLTVAGATTLNNSLAANGQVTVTAANLNGGDGNYAAYPLRVQGSDQGVAIKVNGGRNGGTDFVTFFDDNGVQGRIEGQTTSELGADPEYIFDNSVLVTSSVISDAQAAMAVADAIAASASTTLCAGAGACATAPIPSLITAATANAILAVATAATVTAQVAAYNAFRQTQIGVTYQSGAGDYAEWLPKANAAEKFQFGDVVGVKGGLISKSTFGAEKTMVISARPIVLGNTPEAGKEANFEKVAFMGQVPVKVVGKVQPGDYILASGGGNGFAVAKQPSAMKASDYSRIVGIAWSASDREGSNYVNVAVGLNTNDIAQLVQSQETQIAAQAAEIAALRGQISQTNSTLANLLPGFREAMGSSLAIAAPTQVQASVLLAQPVAQPVAQQKAALDGQRIRFNPLRSQDIEAGFALAEQTLRSQGNDLSKSALLLKISTDAAYKAKIVQLIQKRYDVMLNELVRIEAGR